MCLNYYRQRCSSLEFASRRLNDTRANEFGYVKEVWRAKCRTFMARRKPPRRVLGARGSENVKRRLRVPAPAAAWLHTLADRASFDAHPKHKMEPRAFGLQPFTGQRIDASYCDGHAQFAPSDASRLPNLLRRGILAGLVGANDAKGDPTLVWTVDDNGWIYEAESPCRGELCTTGIRSCRTRPSRAQYLGVTFHSSSMSKTLCSINLCKDFRSATRDRY